jgi:hypothetical protein
MQKPKGICPKSLLEDDEQGQRPLLLLLEKNKICSFEDFHTWKETLGFMVFCEKESAT